MTLDHPDQFFSAAGDSLCFHSDGGSDSTVPCTLDLQTVVCTVDLRTCSNFEMAPSDFPDLMFFCDEVVCVPLIPSQKKDGCSHQSLELKTAMIYMFFTSVCKLLTVTVHHVHSHTTNTHVHKGKNGKCNGFMF